MKLYSLLKWIRSIPTLIKKRYKMGRFNKYSTHGEHLTICPKSNIFVRDRGKVVIGKNCDILGVLSTQDDAIISIGNYTTIRGNSLVGACAGISIGNHVIISNNVHIYDNNNHPTDPQKRIELCESGFYSKLWNWRNSASSPIVIEDNVWIGERATILKGVTIGRGSIVACDSVVTKSVPPYCIVAGNPAKVVKQLNEPV